MKVHHDMQNGAAPKPGPVRNPLKSTMTYGAGAPPPLPFADAQTHFDVHNKARLLSRETRLSYNEGVRQAVDYWRREGLPDDPNAVERQHVETFLAHLADSGKSPATVVNRYKALRAFFRWLHAEGEIDDNPTAGVPWPRVPDYRPRAATLEDVQAMIATCSRRDFRGRRDAALLAFMLDTGWRVSEVLAVKRDQVAPGIPIAVPSKGGQSVEATLAPAVIEYINRYLRTRRDHHPALWMSTWRRPLDRHGVGDIIRRRARLAGRGLLSPHSLRHGHADDWLRNGGNVFDLQRNLGHRQLRTTEIYTKWLAKDRAMKARERFSPGNRLLG